MPRYSPVTSRARFAEAEVEVLQLWRDNRVFERTLEWRKDAPPFVFYEGPPTANGLPGLHHVISRAYKDVFARYKQMAGFSVERKAGWDTHGLPAELEVERALKISGKQQIEAFGIAKFNQLCKESADKYIDEWARVTERLGFWLDMEHPYRTYDGTYIESVWWSLKQLWDRDLLYSGYRVAPYCPRCQTSLSTHQLSLGVQEDTPDPSVYVKFRINDSDGTTFFLAWTTTPWTLPGNVALAVHPHETYVRVSQGGESYILAKERLSVLDPGYEVLEEMRGSDLVDDTYEPLFTDMIPDGLAFVVVAAPELVSMDEGTGIVHTAAAYGVADLELCQRLGIAIRHVVGLDGRFLDGQRRYAGMSVKDADPKIIDDLRQQGMLYRAERITHTYPFCWRCDTALLYYALDSWFIRTTAVKSRLLHHNHSVGWHPEHIRDGRMGDWLENLVDWNLSRTRYWGTPLPIWVCEACGEKRCIGSTAEVGLTAADDLHKPFIDSITLPCQAFGADATRWFFYSAGGLAADLRVTKESFQEVVRLFMLTLWNIYSFFITYAEIDGFDPATATLPAIAELPVLDRWCLARLAQTVDVVRHRMDAYDAQDACRSVESFVEDLSKWYVRRSRRRFWKGERAAAADKRSAYATLHTALVTTARLIAPFMPFVAERMYRNLTGFDGDDAPVDGVPDSVHLIDYPVMDGSWTDPDVLHEMERLRRLVEDGLAARTTAQMRIRQPLRAATVSGAPMDPELEAIFADELNVKSVRYAPVTEGHEGVSLDTEITDELRLEWLARELSRKVNELRRRAELRVEERITLMVDASGDVARAVDAWQPWLAAETLASVVLRERGDALASWEGDIGGEPCWMGVRR